MIARQINSSRKAQTLEKPIAVIVEESLKSLNCYGRMNGRNSSLKLAVSGSDPLLVFTVHFDGSCWETVPTRSAMTFHKGGNSFLKVTCDSEVDILCVQIPGRRITTSGEVTSPLVVDFRSE